MYLLCIRGTANTQDLEVSRKLHNETAGSEPGIAAARALGDLSHKVYVPCTEAGEHAGSKPGELLFIDVWKEPAGIETFFSNKNVQEQGGKLFAAKDPVVAMPGTGAFTFALQAPMSRTDRYLGLIRGTVKSAADAIAAISSGAKEGLSQARARGQLSHELFVRLGPGEPELIGIDVWTDLHGMMKTYAEHTPALLPLFTGRPATSLWSQPKSPWNEW